MEHAVDEFEISPNSTVRQKLISNYNLHIYLLHNKILYMKNRLSYVLYFVK